MLTYRQYLLENRSNRKAVSISQFEDKLLASKDNFEIFDYIKKEIKDRYPEAEDILSKSYCWWGGYLLFLKGMDFTYGTQKLLNLVRERGIEENFAYLNIIVAPKDVQEYICNTRPDLVKQIKNLDPGLAKKYSHEKELGKVDL
jgi:hypothetical protein